MGGFLGNGQHFTINTKRKRPAERYNKTYRSFLLCFHSFHLQILKEGRGWWNMPSFLRWLGS